MNHLTPDELLDAIEAVLPESRRGHLDTCGACRSEVVELSTTLRDARATDVPEPSPLFWEQLSNRVHQSVASATPTPRASSPSWFRWPVLAPLAAMALILFALTNAVHMTNMDATSAPTIADATLDADESWALVPLGTAEQAVLDLTDEEQQELLRLLEQELKGAGS
jgi:hypothetical protein